MKEAIGVYLYVRRTDDEPAGYQVLQHEAKVVRSIFSWLVEEKISIDEIARRLRAQGVPTRTGKSHWDRSVVWAILRNPAYAGQAAFGETESVERRQLLRDSQQECYAPPDEELVSGQAARGLELDPTRVIGHSDLACTAE